MNFAGTLDRIESTWLLAAKGYVPLSFSIDDFQERCLVINAENRRNTSKKELLRFMVSANKLCDDLYGLKEVSARNMLSIYSELCKKVVGPDEVFEYTKNLIPSCGQDELKRNEAHLKMMIDLIARLQLGAWKKGSLCEEAFSLFYTDESFRAQIT